MPLRLLPFPEESAGTVSGWAGTGEETMMWCGRPDAPVPAEQIIAWSDEPGIQPYGLIQNDRLVGYGELWVDDDEAEVELGRLIVDPAQRGHGLGRRLVTELSAVARQRYGHVFTRVHPANAAARHCCAAAGFIPVDAQLTAERNAPQPMDYVWLTLGPQRISTSRTIAAPAAAIFEVISDPDGHVRLDGSGMLVAAGSTARLTAVGDAFEMEMDREPLGDLPMGRYRTRNVVTRIEVPYQLEWAVGSAEGQLLGHVYGYELSPDGDDRTAVTSYCDWSGVPASWLARVRWPVVPLDRLERSLANLDALVTRTP